MSTDDTPNGKRNIGAHVTDAMRTQPLALALIVINLMFLLAGVFGIYLISKQYDTRSEAREHLINELLVKCGPMGKQMNP